MYSPLENCGQKVKKTRRGHSQNMRAKLQKYAVFLCTLTCKKTCIEILVYAYYYYFCNNDLNVKNKMCSLFIF